MINSTLGGLIKDYRLQKDISQLDISFALGWKEPSRLSRIEQGRTEKPSRELVDKIIKAIGLEEEEKNTLLLIGGYLPTQDEIEKIRLETKKIIEEWPYPANVLDFSWRSIAQNEQTIRTYNMQPEQVRLLKEHCPRIMDILFSQDLIQDPSYRSEQLKQWENFLKTIILNFKYEQRHRTKEKWYIEHIRELMKNELFRELWVEVDVRDKLHGVVGKSTQTSVICPEEPNRLLNFYLFVVPVLKDPRFEVQLLVPKDIGTYTYYQK